MKPKRISASTTLSSHNATATTITRSATTVATNACRAVAAAVHVSSSTFAGVPPRTLPKRRGRFATEQPGITRDPIDDKESALSPNRSFIQQNLAAPLERAGSIDALAEPLQKAARRALPEDSLAKELLSGSWLGHPLHPLLTDVVVGAWTSGAILDLLGGKDRRTAADDLVAVGVLAALPTALTGLSDWAELQDGSRRVGSAHALGNLAAIALQSGSWLLRRRGHRSAGIALSTGGLLVSALSAWLGGHMSFGQGVGVNQTVFEDPPSRWTSVIDEDKLSEGKLVRRSANGTGVVLVRHHGHVHALTDRCSHRGCSLSEGSFDGTAITCRCHGSRFALDGRLLRGPATASQPALETRVRDDRVEVRRA